MPLPQPDLPEPAHPEVDSMLSRKFGKEIANYFSVLLFNKLEPLVNSSTSIATARFADVTSIVGVDPFSRTEEDTIAEYNSSVYVPQIIFLGLDERSEGLVYKDHYKGVPWFAVDVTPKGSVTEECEKLIKKMTADGKEFSKGRMHLSLPAQEGFKRTCPPKDIAPAVQNPERPPCATRTGISNLCFPRTDPTVIMAVVSADGQRMLLGRQKRWPPYWYSTLAGFLEPAESVEEAVRREVWEESGVHLGRVVIHSTQPWPYPANLMIGAIGQAIPGGEDIHLGHDAELEDAKWFTAEELREALRVGTSGLGEEAGPEYKEGGLRVPPQTAIANQLMTAVVNGFASGTSMI
ncbi:NADH pyrophosphatase [Paraconiothyrium brasiliense]|uniref:NAD(+) diphosphatase n=1 Tax=Paraconiothyrium brasiliense TaxID=300254 RepID=A0ABR3QNY8_9PLEO